MAQAYLERAPGFAGVTFTLHPMVTTGDRITDRPLYDEGGKGLFVKELEEALLADQIDIAINSLKDVESILDPAFTLAAYLPREDARDILITQNGFSLETLPAGTLIGTSSPRRMAQTLHKRPDCAIAPIRGNVGTRLDMLTQGRVEGLILAAAGLKRLDLIDPRMVFLEPEQMLPACGQGVLAIECLTSRDDLHTLLADVTDPQSHLCATAERALLRALGGSCRTPIGAYARVLNTGQIHLSGMLAQEIGADPLFAQATGSNPDALGIAVAEALCALGKKS
jgi:hydroxymethylbilane synthase